jgi:phosphomethylpyrimidine synthase
MSAIPKDLLQQAATLTSDAIRPFPASRKVFLPGSRDDIRVPVREIAQSATRTAAGADPNPSVTVYDTSGPYTDPAVRIDLLRGLPKLRSKWIAARRTPGPCGA